MARCEQDDYTIVTTLSLENSWVHPHKYVSLWKIENYTQLCPVEQVTVVWRAPIDASEKRLWPPHSVPPNDQNTELEINIVEPYL